MHLIGTMLLIGGGCSAGSPSDPDNHGIFMWGLVMFGIGAAFNYYVGAINEPKMQIGGLRFIWLQRIFEEPKKQIRRCWHFLTVIPKVKREEKRKLKSKKA